MATTGKPQTTFVVSYGTLGETVAQEMLTPVFIAPRYAIHDQYDEKNSLGEFLVGSKPGVEWPALEEGAKVDVASGELFVKNAVIKLNKTAIAAESISGNVIKLGEDVSVKLGGVVGLCDALEGVEVMVGDRVIVDSDGKLTEADVVDIRPAYKDAEATVVRSSNTQCADGMITADASKFIAKKTASYLVKFLEDGVARAEITALTGDAGYRTTETIGDDTAVGAFGLVIAVAGDASTIKAGDSFIVTVSPKAVSAYNEVIVNASLSVTGGSVYFATSRMSQEYTALSTAAWDATPAAITVAETAMVTVGSEARELVGGELRIAYRALLTDNALQLVSCATEGIADIAGVVDPNNPFGMMYGCASRVSGGFFYMVSVAEDTEDAYLEAIEYVGKFESLYAPITAMQTAAIQAATIAMINKYSAKEIAKYKKTWFAPLSTRTSVVYGETIDGAALVGSVDADGSLKLEGDADAVVAGVRGGDFARIYLGASANDTTFGFKEYKVDSVIDATTVKLVDGMLSGISRVEFVRTLNSHEYAEKLATEARAIGSHRVNFVVSDELNWGGFTGVDKIYLAATLATMRSALPPHAPMNELVVPGFTVSDSYKWTDVDYEAMNAGGCWIVYNNDSNEAVTYHQITTISDGTIAEEDSAVSNGDAIVRALRTAVRPIASGKANVSGALLNLIDKTLRSEISFIMGKEYADIYGPQIQDYKILALYIPDGNRKSVRCKVQLQLPLPLQDGEFEFNLI